MNTDMVAPQCLCGKYELPHLVNVTGFDDVEPRWLVVWQCPSTGSSEHRELMERLGKYLVQQGLLKATK